MGEREKRFIRSPNKKVAAFVPVSVKVCIPLSLNEDSDCHLFIARIPEFTSTLLYIIKKSFTHSEKINIISA